LIFENQHRGGINPATVSLFASLATSFGTILNIFPIARPFLAPLKWSVAINTSFGLETVLYFCLHGKLIDEMCKGPSPNPSEKEDTKRIKNVEKFHESMVLLSTTVKAEFHYLP